MAFLYIGVTLALCDDTVENNPSGHSDSVDLDLIENLVRRIDGLDTQMKKQAVTIRQQAEVNRQEAETNRRKAGVIEQLQLKLGAVEEELATLKSSQAVFDDTTEDKDTGVLSTNPEASKQPTKIALMGSAYLDHSLTHLGIDHPIVYNRVLLNEGGAYNIHTGIFTCPHDGIYMFNFLVATDGIHQIIAKLVVDGVNTVDGIYDTFHRYHEAQGGNYVILSLKVGQSVWVANCRWSDAVDNSSDANRFSTFSGHLVF